jgi:hypothetical protein
MAKQKIYAFTQNVCSNACVVKYPIDAILWADKFLKTYIMSFETFYLSFDMFIIYCMHILTYFSLLYTTTNSEESEPML